MIAGKSRTISTAVGVAETIAARLEAEGFPIIQADTSPDLGIDRGRCVGSQKPTASKRQAAAASKNSKFVGLIRATKKWSAAKLLFTSGVQSQAAYHAQVHGMPPTRKRSLRRGAGAMMSHANRGRCLTTRLAVELGDKDPAISVPMSLFEAWFKYMVAFPEDRVRVAAVWPRIAKLLQRPKTRWRYVRGPAAAVISTLLDAGWTTTSANVWVQADGTTWTFSAEFLADKFPDFSAVKTALAADLRSQLWANAAEFRNGKGLEAGADMRPLVKHLKSLSKNGRYEMHGAVLCCATASAWTNARVAEEYPEADNLCPRCKIAPETELHRHWECQANDEIKACNRSKHLIPKARLRASVCPAFWLRGIVPAEWTKVPPPPQAADPCEDNIDGEPDRAGTPASRLWCCGDGSGGVNTKDPRLRRCGWAWVELQNCNGAPSSQLHRVKCAPLHGSRQTVNRAELLALLDCLQSTQGSITFVSDSAYVVNGFAQLFSRKGKYNPRSHRDLWSALAVASSARDVEVVKVESHLSESHPLVLDGTFPISWVKGNDAADVLAGEAAADAQVPSSCVEAINWVDATAYLVRTRLAATLMSAAEANPHRTAPPRPAKIRVPVAEARVSALDQALATTAHTPDTRKAGTYSCGVCGTSALLEHVVPWLNTTCTKPTALPFCPQVAAPAKGAEVRLGNAVIHASHQPVFYPEQRTWACTSCGRAAVSFMRELAGVCKGKVGCTAKGKLNLSRLGRGLMIGDSAAAKEFNLAKGNTTGKRLPAAPKAAPKGAKLPPAPTPAVAVTMPRGTKRASEETNAPSAAFTAMRDRIRSRESLAASSACAAEPYEALSSSSACAAAITPAEHAAAAQSKFASLRADAAERDLELSYSFSLPAVTSHAGSTSIAENDDAEAAATRPPAPVTSLQIEAKRLAAVAKRAKRERLESTAAAVAVYSRRATEAYEAAVRQEATAAATPLPDPDTEEEWENELMAYQAEQTDANVSSPVAESAPVLRRTSSPFARLGATPLNLISAFLGDHCQAPEEAVTPAAPEPTPPPAVLPPPPELFLEHDIEQLEILLDLHLDGLPVTWPAGLNAYVAGIAVRHRRARR